MKENEDEPKITTWIRLQRTFLSSTNIEDKEKIEDKVAPHTNPAIPMKIPFDPKGFQDVTYAELVDG